MDYKQFASNIKAKYPQYKDMSDEELSKKMVAKYPKEYSDITFGEEPTIAEGAKSLLGTKSLLDLERYTKETPEREFAEGLIKGGYEGVTAGLGPELPTTAKGGTEKLGQLIGTTAGMGMGIPGKVAGTLMGSIPLRSAKLLPIVAKTAVSGATTGFLTPPSDVQKAEDESLMEVNTRLKNAAIGLGLGTALGTATYGAKKIVDIAKARTFTERKALLENLYKDGYVARDAAQSKYGAELQAAIKANPKAPVSWRDDMTAYNAQDKVGMLDPQIKIAINKVPALKKWFNNPESAATITIKQADEAITKLNASLPQTVFKKGGLKYRALKDFTNDLKASLYDAAPGMSDAKEAYSKFIQPYKIYKREIDQMGIINKLRNTDNQPLDPRIEEAVMKFASNATKQRITDYKTALNTISMSKELAKGLVYLLGGSYGLVKVGEAVGLAK